MRLSLPVVSLVLAASAAAQTVSLPANAQSGDVSSQALGWNGPERTQLIFGPAVLPPGDLTISTLHLRPPADHEAAGMVVDLRVTLASAGVPMPAAASTTSYAANRGTTSQTTVRNGVVLPALAPGVPVSVPIPLEAPFHRAAGQPLLIEIDLAVVSYGGIFPSWPTRTVAFETEYWNPTIDVLGTSCVAGDMFGKASTSAYPAREVAGWKFFGAHAPGTPAVLLLGLSDQVYGVLPLPVDLGFLGAPGCSLQVAVDDVRLVFGTTTGYSPQFPTQFAAGVELPRDPWFAGTRVSGQFAIIDAAHNRAGVALTPRARFELVTPPTPERMRYSHSFLAPPLPEDEIQSWLPDRAFAFDIVLL